MLFPSISGSSWRWLILVLGLWACAGCANFRPALDRAEAGAEVAESPSGEGPKVRGFTPDEIKSGELQQSVMDFADAYMAATWQALDEYLAVETDPAKRIAAQLWRVRYSGAAMTIAASKDPRTNLFDMAVFISVGHWAVKNYWVPTVFGPQAAKLETVYATLEDEIWQEVTRTLSLGHRNDLRALISTWEANDHPIYEVADVRLRNLDGINLRHFDEASTAQGLMATFRRLWGSVDNSLLYGERVMFYLERTPRIFSQQVDLTLSRIDSMAPLTSLSADVTRLVDTLQALPVQITEGLNQNQDVIREVLPQIRTTLDSANQLTVSLNETLGNLRGLSEETKVTSLDPQRYVPVLQQATASLAHLDSVVGGLDRMLAEDGTPNSPSKVEKLGRVLHEGTDEMVDKIYRRVLILLGVFFAGVIISILLARLLFRRKQTV